MLSTTPPKLVPLAWATSGTKNAIPTLSQVAIKDGAASLETGFPPLTFTPLSAGGVAPDGADFNGVLNLITQLQQWQSAGAAIQYNVDLVNAIGGYPKGAIIQGSDGTLWKSLIENNTRVPGLVGWMRVGGLHASNFNTIVGPVTLTVAEHAGSTIYMGGGGGYGITLPDVTTVPAGSRFEFIGGLGTATAYIVTVLNQIVYLSAATTLTSIPMSLGDTITLESNGVSWIAVAGSNQIGYSNAFSRSLTANGFQKLPSGLIVQWGQGTTAANGVFGVNFPIAFPNGALSCTAAEANSGSWAQGFFAVYGASALTNTGVTMIARLCNAGSVSAGSGFFNYIAIGF